MSRTVYKINGFFGIDQSAHDNALPAGTSPNARNMDTSFGNLTVAKGFSRYISEPVPGNAPIYKLALFRYPLGDQLLVFSGEKLFVWRNLRWRELYDFGTDAAAHDFHVLSVSLTTSNYLLISTGKTQLLKYDGFSISKFGSSEKLSDIHVKYLAMYKNRLFSAGDFDNPNRLYWSQLPGDSRRIDNWGQSDDGINTEGGHTEIGPVGNDPIIGLVTLSSQLLIVKAHSIFRLIGDRPSNFTVEQVDFDTVCSGQQGIACFSDIAYFLSCDGLCMFDGVSVRRSNDASKLARLMQDADTKKARAAKVGDKLYFAIKLFSDDLLVEYDLGRGTYMLRDGFAISDIIGVDRRLLFINDKRYVYEFNSGDSYDGEPIHAYWETPLTDLYEKSIVKSPRTLLMRGKSDNGACMLLSVQTDSLLQRERVALCADDTLVFELPIKNSGRTLRLRFENEHGGHFSVTGGVELCTNIAGMTV